MDWAAIKLAFVTRLEGVLQSTTCDMVTADAAILDVQEMIGTRSVPAYLAVDIAVFRYRIRQKIAPSETETALYDWARKAVQDTPIPTEDGTLTGGAIRVGQRTSDIA